MRLTKSRKPLSVIEKNLLNKFVFFIFFAKLEVANLQLPSERWLRKLRGVNNNEDGERKYDKKEIFFSLILMMMMMMMFTKPRRMHVIQIEGARKRKHIGLSAALSQVSVRNIQI